MVILSNHSDDRLRAALWYARQGWPVYPVTSIRPDNNYCLCGDADCNSPGKHPSIRDWLNQATIDPALIRHWWQRGSLANVGIVTGTRSGIVVLDLDGQSGIEECFKFAEHHGVWPVTFEVESGGGGRHLYFKLPKGKALRSSNHVHDLPIDFKAEGGGIIAPPSVHPSGRRYKRINEVLPIVIPQWLLEWVEQWMQSKTITPSSLPRVFVGSLDDQKGKAITYTRKVEPAVQGQNGSNLTFRLVCRLLEIFGLDEEQTLSVLCHEWNARCQPPWSEEELRHKYRDAAAKVYGRGGGHA